MKYHLLAHNEKNEVKIGEKVEKYKTVIGSIGTANGSYWAHLHHSQSDGLTIEKLIEYVKGWTKDEVEKYYSKPTCDYNKMFGKNMDIGNNGYGWLDDIGGGFHPGIDINGMGGGNSDIGYEYTSPCDGKVIYVSDTNNQDGWGKMVIIEESEESEENSLIKIVGDFIGRNFGKKINENELKEIKNFFESKNKELSEKENKIIEKTGENIVLRDTILKLEQELKDYQKIENKENKIKNLFLKIFK